MTETFLPATETSLGSQRPYKRRLFLIKRKLQFKFIAYVMLSVLVALMLMGGDIYSTIGDDLVRDLMDPGLVGLFRNVGYVLTLKLLGYMVFVAFLALLVSHKIAGPIFRFERSVHAVAEGDLTHRVKLRKGDELEDLQDGFNRMVKSLQDHVAKDQALARSAHAQLGGLLGDSGISAASQDVLKKIQADLGRIGSSLKI